MWHINHQVPQVLGENKTRDKRNTLNQSTIYILSKLHLELTCGLTEELRYIQNLLGGLNKTKKSIQNPTLAIEINEIN